MCENNQGKWAKQLLRQLATADGNPQERRAELHSEKNCRAMQNAQARDAIDRWAGNLIADMLNAGLTEEDFQDRFFLDEYLTPIIDALLKYEELSYPKWGDPLLLEHLQNLLYLIRWFDTGLYTTLKPHAKMAQLRAKRLPTVRARNLAIEAEARRLRRQNPKRSVRSLALSIGEKVGLAVNTVEKKLANMGF
jgi:hypothetical protein